MSTGLNRKKTAKWPFWLLVAAWWCANTPQAATFEVILWLKGAANYSHQADLRAEVEAVMSGVPQVAQSQRSPSLGETPPPAVPLAKTVAIKRVSLCLHEESISSDGPSAAETMSVVHDQVPERRTSPPRLRPPRLV